MAVAAERFPQSLTERTIPIRRRGASTPTRPPVIAAFSRSCTQAEGHRAITTPGCPQATIFVHSSRDMAYDRRLRAIHMIRKGQVCLIAGSRRSVWLHGFISSRSLRQAKFRHHLPRPWLTKSCKHISASDHYSVCRKLTHELRAFLSAGSGVNLQYSFGRLA